MLWPFLGISVSPSVFLDMHVCGSIQIKYAELFMSTALRQAHASLYDSEEKVKQKLQQLLLWS